MKHEFRNAKIVVGENSKEIQEILFGLGYRWKIKGTLVSMLESPFLFIDSDGIISYENNNEFFYEHENILITLDTLKQWVEEDKQQPFICPFIDKVKNIFTPCCHFDIEIGGYYVSMFQATKFILKVSNIEIDCIRASISMNSNHNERLENGIGYSKEYITRPATLDEIILLEKSPNKKERLSKVWWAD